MHLEGLRPPTVTVPRRRPTSRPCALVGAVADATPELSFQVCGTAVATEHINGFKDGTMDGYIAAICSWREFNLIVDAATVFVLLAD